MATNRIVIDAPREAVWGVLTDAASYGIWVVGSKRIRGVDATWPEPGSSFHHTVGWGPFEDRDTSIILEAAPPAELVLEVRARPFGTARVSLTLRPADGHTELTMVESPVDGMAKRFEGRPLHAAIYARNTIALRRLKSWAEQRYHATPGVGTMPT